MKGTGDGVLTYYVPENLEDAMRVGSIIVAEQYFGIIQDGASPADGLCPAAYLLEDKDPQLNTIRQFRDDVIARSPTGRKLIKIFYEHDEKIYELLVKHPGIRKSAKAILESLIPVIELLLQIN